MSEKKELEKAGGRNGWAVWNPFEEMRGFRRAVSHLLGDAFNGGSLADWDVDLDGGRTNWFPAVNVEETDKEYVFSADVPGLQKEDVNVEIEQGLLKIRGERKSEKEEKSKNYVRREQYYGAFNRTFSLPTDAKTDDVKADYKNGVLTVHIARTPELKPKNVKIAVQ